METSNKSGKRRSSGRKISISSRAEEDLFVEVEDNRVEELRDKTQGDGEIEMIEK